MAKTDFYIAQYIRDPLRREPKNVGLFVIKDGECDGRFLGEDTLVGDTDLRTIKWAAEPKIYRKWVQAWREELQGGADRLFERLAENNGPNYQVLIGGSVTGTNGDPAALVCEKLFSTLVSDSESDKAEREARESQNADLRKIIKSDFGALGILAGNRDPALHNPIYVKPPVVGKLTTHEPSFYQQTDDEAYVMEVINFDTPRKGPAAWHAGFVAKMFDDIKSKPRQTKLRRAVLVRAKPDDMSDKAVKYAMELLGGSVDRLVNWNDGAEKRDFLRARRDAAYATGA